MLTKKERKEIIKGNTKNPKQQQQKNQNRNATS